MSAALAADFYRLAVQHRPDAASVAVEIRKLFAIGLTAYDIASAMRIDVAAVRLALLEPIA